MTFLDPLVVLIPKLVLKFGVWVPSGAASVRVEGSRIS